MGKHGVRRQGIVPSPFVPRALPRAQFLKASLLAGRGGSQVEAPRTSVAGFAHDLDARSPAIQWLPACRAPVKRGIWHRWRMGLQRHLLPQKEAILAAVTRIPSAATSGVWPNAPRPAGRPRRAVRFGARPHWSLFRFRSRRTRPRAASRSATLSEPSRERVRATAAPLQKSNRPGEAKSSDARWRHCHPVAAARAGSAPRSARRQAPR